MSVAFRRESDEEHLEPKFDVPLPPGPNLVTARGLALIQAKVAELEAALDGADDEVATAIRRDLKYWHTRATTAQVAPIADGDEAAFGTRVRYRMDGQEAAVEIVGADEADPGAGRIAFTAPLARALIGLGEGEKAAFAGREDAITVLGVEVLSA